MSILFKMIGRLFNNFSKLRCYSLKQE